VGIRSKPNTRHTKKERDAAESHTNQVEEIRLKR
jgi:hypothetical protein